MEGLKIGIIGSGNVAFHLAKAFSEQKNEISIFRKSDRNEEHFNELKNIHQVDSIRDFPDNIEFYILAVSDGKIKNVAHELKGTNAFVLHTSGSISMDVFADLNFSNYGVFYPLQSFTVKRELNYREIPVLLESIHKEEIKQLKQLVSSFSDISQVVTSEKRKKIHLAAVVVNNFVNHLYVEAADLLEGDNMSELLIPLIKETTSRLESDRAITLQTGPAKRGDDAVIQDHLSMLDDYPDLQKLYKVMSDSIRSKHQP